MKEIVATAAATSLTVVSSLLSILPSPQVAAPALFVAASVPQSVYAAQHQGPDITHPETSKTTPPVVADPSMGKEAVKALIKHYADQYGVNPGIMEFVVACETGASFDPKIQSFATYKKDRPEYGVKKGDRELSFGLAQIHLPANPGITLEQATDPDFALNFLAQGLARAEFWRWSCL